MRRLLLSLTLALVVGCTTLTAQQTLAETDAQFTALAQTATDLVLSGTIHGADAEHVKSLVDQGSAALDAAWQAQAAGQPYSLTTVIAVDSALQQLKQQYGGK